MHKGQMHKRQWLGQRKIQDYYLNSNNFLNIKDMDYQFYWAVVDGKIRSRLEGKILSGEELYNLSTKKWSDIDRYALPVDLEISVEDVEKIFPWDEPLSLMELLEIRTELRNKINNELPNRQLTPEECNYYLEEIITPHRIKALEYAKGLGANSTSIAKLMSLEGIEPYETLWVDGKKIAEDFYNKVKNISQAVQDTIYEIAEEIESREKQPVYVTKNNEQRVCSYDKNELKSFITNKGISPVLIPQIRFVDIVLDSYCECGLLDDYENLWTKLKNESFVISTEDNENTIVYENKSHKNDAKCKKDNLKKNTFYRLKSALEEYKEELNGA